MPATQSIGLDVGGSHVRAALVDTSGQIAHRARRSLGDKTPESVAEVCADLIVALTPSADLPVGIGIAAMLSAPDANDARHVRNAPNLGWRDEDFASRLHARMLTHRNGARGPDDVGPAALRPRLLNDADAILLGELSVRSKGDARGVRDVLLVAVGTGVGAAALCGGQLLTGAQGAAMELGHTAVVPRDAPNARRCGCGRTGCLEAYASGICVEQSLRKLTGAAPDVPARDVFAEAHAHHPEAVEAAFADATTYIARATADAAVLLGPALIVMGGGLFAPYEARLQALCTATHNALPAHFSTRVVPATLGDDAGVIGAARYALERA